MSTHTSGTFRDRGLNTPDFHTAIGSMRERVTLLTVETVASTSDGFKSTTPVEVACLPAEILPLSGDDAFALGGQRGLVVYEVRIRHRTDVRTGSQLSWDQPDGSARTLQVLTPPVNRDGRRRFLWLSCGLVEQAA